MLCAQHTCIHNFTLYIRKIIFVCDIKQLYLLHRAVSKLLYESMMTEIPGVTRSQWVNTLRPWQKGRYFPDDIFECIFLKENIWIPIKISLKFVPKSPINNIPALVQIMAWRRPGDKPLSEPMMVNLPTHICVTRSQWVNITLRSPWIFHVSCYIETFSQQRIQIA